MASTCAARGRPLARPGTGATGLRTAQVATQKRALFARMRNTAAMTSGGMLPELMKAAGGGEKIVQDLQSRAAAIQRAGHGEGSAVWSTSRGGPPLCVQLASSRPPRSQWSVKEHAACAPHDACVTPTAAASATASSRGMAISGSATVSALKTSDRSPSRPQRTSAKSDSVAAWPPVRARRLESRLCTIRDVCCKYSIAKFEDGEPTGDTHVPAMAAATELAVTRTGGARSAQRSRSRRSTSITLPPSRAWRTASPPLKRQSQMRRTTQPAALSSSLHATAPSDVQKKANKRCASSPAPLQTLSVSQTPRRRAT